MKTVKPKTSTKGRPARAVPQGPVACAISYDDARMDAPLVSAVGQDHLAVELRKAALRWGIPVVEDTELADRLYEVGTDSEIPEELYVPVAQLLVDIEED